jgi:uroporphyrinogen decarboxylase
MTHGSTKNLLNALGGAVVWPPPIWLMRQAGRYLPEYGEIRGKAGDFLALCLTPELAAEVTLQPIRRFGFDAAILFSDILILPWALGRTLTFREGEGPVLPPLRDMASLAALDRQRLPRAIAPVLETVQQVRRQLEAEGFSGTALIGFAGAPFTVACYMVEGGGSKDFAVTRSLAYENPHLLEVLTEVLIDASVTYLSAQITAGADAVMLFDSWAGVLAPPLFRQYVIEPTRRIVSALKAQFPLVPIIGFPRLAGLMLQEYVRATSVDAVGVDTSMDPQRVAELIPAHVAIQGNLDPLALVAGGRPMRHSAEAILAAMRGRPFVFNLGHGIVPQTRPEHVAALVKMVRAA